MDSLMFHPGPPCPTLLRPTLSSTVFYPFGLWTPHAVRLCPGSDSYDNRSLQILSDLYLDHLSKAPFPVKIDSPKFFMFFTATWIVLGGLGQTATILHFLRKKDPLLSTLPLPVRLLVCCTAPILLAPVVLNVFGIYLVIKKKVNAMIRQTLNG
jgi:hypothetical protein